ncbi:MAG: hypothetical protein [Caudoviricetes sp.]|nr:MAG: hypothetical protein [Caudoviricetes sp.]
MLRPKLNRLWGGSNAPTRRDPGDEKYIQGWISEIPTFQVLNFLQYKMDSTMLAQAERGFFEWGSDVTYARGAMAWDETDKQIYVSTAQAPSKTLKPSSNTAQWKVSSIQITRQEYDTIVAAMNSHIADVSGNPHQLTPGRLGAYTKAEVDAIATTYRNLVSAHASNTSNPHKTTAAAIGAVPITGGTYTNDVVFATGQILLDAAGSNKVGMISGNGVYLQAGTGIIGLNAAGDAVAGTAAAPTKIITEKTFSDYKAGVEPDYASPAPIWYWPLVGDINVYAGTGTVNSIYAVGSAPWDTTFTGALNCGNDAAERQVKYTASPLEGLMEASMALDVFVPAVVENVAQVEAFFSTGSGTGSLIIEVRKNNTMRVNSSIPTPAIAITPNVWHRIVAVRTATGISCYVDGVLANSASGTNNPITGAGYNFLRLYGQAAATQRAYQVRNARMWNVALTAKQVSNL